MCGWWKQVACVFVLCSSSAVIVNAQDKTPPPTQKVIGQTVTLVDGYTFVVDEVYKQGDELWYRKGNMSRQMPQAVKSVKPIYEQPKPEEKKPAAAAEASAVKPTPTAIWIHLVDGAKFRVDEVQESTDGALYTRNKVSIFLDKERIARIEYETPSSPVATRKSADWTSGNLQIDQLIRTNGQRFGIDPYLVFLVIEKESRFHPRAVSPKGAMGLMQLMPGTARRLGVRKPFDVAENIRAGTQYMRELMDMFDNKVELVLASYNAGEGAVLRYGKSVPPYRETRDYVKTIGKRYGLTGRQDAQNEVPDPQR